MKLKVATWNIHRCIGTDRKYDPERVARVIRELDADVVALQEVDTSLKGTDGRDQLAVLARVTGLQQIYGATRTQAAGHFGNAFLHRHTALSKRTLNLSYRKNEPRGALAVQFDVGGKRVDLTTTHLGLKSWERAFQISALLNDLRFQRAGGNPAIQCLLGDFNEWLPFSLNLMRLHREFQKPPRLRTFPSVWPRLALDRIYVAHAAATPRLEVVQDAIARRASDHLPLVAEFEI